MENGIRLSFSLFLANWTFLFSPPPSLAIHTFFVSFYNNLHPFTIKLQITIYYLPSLS